MATIALSLPQEQSQMAKLVEWMLHDLYRDKDIMCMTSTQWLAGIYNDAANKSWSKSTTLTK